MLHYLQTHGFFFQLLKYILKCSIFLNGKQIHEPIKKNLKLFKLHIVLNYVSLIEMFPSSDISSHKSSVLLLLAIISLLDCSKIVP